jgi:hypothetical protein
MVPMSAVAAAPRFDPNRYLPKKRDSIPKGTVGVAVEMLFPQQRSIVPIDKKRAYEVFDILALYGVIEEGSSGTKEE